MAEISLMFREVQSATNQKLMNLDFNRFENYLTPEDRIKVMNPSELPVVLKTSIEYKDCQSKLTTLARKGIDLAG